MEDKHKTEDKIKDKTEEAQDNKNKGDPKKKKKVKMIKVSEEEYQSLQNEIIEVKDKHLRLYAEFDNVRKRVERERQDFVKYSTENVIVDFLEIFDDLTRTVSAVEQEKKEGQSAFFKGLEMVMNRIQDFLKNNGVKPIKALGAQFDPNCHEIMMQEETDKHEDNTVIEVFQQGYCLYEKVVRTAKVKLAKNQASSHSDSLDNDEDDSKNKVQDIILD